MKELLLCKYGEVILKGANRSSFESLLMKDLKNKLVSCGEYRLYKAQGTIYAEPMNENCDSDAAFDAACKTFGFASVARAAVTEKNMEAILRTVGEYVPPFLQGAKTFKVEAKRSDKKFPLTSPEIAAQAGGVILEKMPHLKVDVHNPEVVVMVEIRDYGAYVHAGKTKGAGGLPKGSSGKALLLLSGGIDSPVAGHMMAKRGAFLEALYFESMPYTSERAREKVITLAKKLAVYSGNLVLHIVSLTEIQEALRDHCTEDYFTLLLRRFMMRLANRIAKKVGAEILVTGESLGQVASQTMKAMIATEAVSEIPVFRPCIGLDKEEIVVRAREIDTFETSILPYEDCCTVFTPRHPKTQPTIDKIEEEEAKIDVTSLEEAALATSFFVRVERE